MNQKELETINHLVSSNNSFCNALKEKKTIRIDIYIQIELLLLYFKINYKYICRLTSIEQELIYDLINNNNFIIEENYLVYKGENYSLDFLKNIINKIEKIKYDNSQNKVIQFIPPIKENISHPVKSKKSKIVDITFLNHAIFLDMKDRLHLLEEGLEITSETQPYIEENNANFRELLNTLILALLKPTPFEYSYGYLEILSSYLCLYPIISYAKNKFVIPLSDIKIPKERIGLKKCEYQDEYLDELSSEIRDLNNKRMRLILSKNAMPKSLQNYEIKLERINSHIDAIEKKQIDCYYNQFAYRNLDEIYNPLFLEFLYKAYEQCNVSIDEIFENPVIRFFHLNNDGIDFYCAMRLDTLLEFGNYSSVIPKLEHPNFLKLTI